MSLMKADVECLISAYLVRMMDLDNRNVISQTDHTSQHGVEGRFQWAWSNDKLLKTMYGCSCFVHVWFRAEVEQMFVFGTCLAERSFSCPPPKELI